MTMPALDYRRPTSIIGRHGVVWRARDLSLTARTGQVGTLTRATTGAADDSFGVSRTLVHSQPRWHVNAGVVSLRLGGGVTEYLSWPFNMLPGAYSILVDFFENGTLGSVNAGLWSITNSAAANPRHFCNENGGKYSVTHHNGTSSVIATMATAPTSLQRNYLRTWLYSDGKVQIWQSINGAAETTPGASGTLTLPAAWATTTLFYLNSVATANVGTTLVNGVVVMRGNQTQAKLLEALA